MKIPPDAIVAPEKLSRYLLIPKSRNDKSRYLARAGFTLRDPDDLERAIRVLVASVDAVEDTVDEFGTDYLVKGRPTGPNGVELPVELVWVRRDDGMFRFVTLKPVKERRK